MFKLDEKKLSEFPLSDSKTLGIKEIPDLFALRIDY